MAIMKVSLRFGRLSCKYSRTRKKANARENMTTKIGIEAGADETPAIENCSTVHSYAPKLYITDPSDDFEQLRTHPLIRQFASVKPDTYQIIKQTNPTLLLFINLAKEISGVDE